MRYGMTYTLRRCVRRGAALVMILVIAPTLTACRESEPEPELPERETLSVMELGRIGGRVYNEPGRAEEILEEIGMTPEEFEQRVRRITNDPEQSREYTVGFESVARIPDARDSLPDSLLAPDPGVAPDTGGSG